MAERYIEELARAWGCVVRRSDKTQLTWVLRPDGKAPTVDFAMAHAEAWAAVLARYVETLRGYFAEKEE